MQFPENSIVLLSKQFLLFTKLFTSASRCTLKFNEFLLTEDINSKENQKDLAIIMDLKAIVSILNIAWSFSCFNDSEETIDPISLLKASVERWLQGFIHTRKIEDLMQAFNMAFGLISNER